MVFPEAVEFKRDVLRDRFDKYGCLRCSSLRSFRKISGKKTNPTYLVSTIICANKTVIDAEELKQWKSMLISGSLEYIRLTSTIGTWKILEGQLQNIHFKSLYEFIRVLSSSLFNCLRIDQSFFADEIFLWRNYAAYLGGNNKIRVLTSLNVTEETSGFDRKEYEDSSPKLYVDWLSDL